ncbi:MAG: NAD(P)-dependent oxidoreductase [Bacteroidia bacterium]|nr:NAD(P)-dependent oxidoreductase [Bacteroidia bacterium]
MINTIAITGAGGFIGNELVNYFLSKGKKVIAMNRSVVTNTHENFRYLPYDLVQKPDFSLLTDADCIIHCAFMVWDEAKAKDDFNSDYINANATGLLAQFCEKNKKKFVFMSSFSAHEKATSHYGKHKFELEENLASTHMVIKPGLVLGKKGLFASINKIVSEKKIIPVIGNGQQPLQWIHVKELCMATEIGLEKDLVGAFPLASEKSITFLMLNELIAQKSNRSPIFIFIHPAIAKILLAIFGKKLPFTKENLDGLLQLREFETKDTLELFGISIAPIEEFSL